MSDSANVLDVDRVPASALDLNKKTTDASVPRRRRPAQRDMNSEWAAQQGRQTWSSSQAPAEQEELPVWPAPRPQSTGAEAFSMDATVPPVLL